MSQIKSKNIAKKEIIRYVAYELMIRYKLDEIAVMDKITKTSTFEWLMDDSSGIAREGRDAVLCRFISEFENNVIL